MVLHPRSRRGFTLIELMVAIGIAAILATLAVMFLPHLDRHKGVPNGITQLQGWINLSKMQALRDKAPRGVRLIHDGTGKVTQVVYIEQPDPIAPTGTNIEAWLSAANPNDPNPPPSPNGNVGQVTLRNVANLAGPPVFLNWPDEVQPGDFFQSTDSPAFVARITNIDGPPAAPRTRLTLERFIDGTETNIPIRMAKGYRVIRAPRPLAGEPALQLHKDIFIDLAYCHPCPIGAASFPTAPHVADNTWANWNSYLPWGTVPNGTDFHIDILFNSYGIIANAPVGHYGIFVRHVDRPNDEKAVLMIYTRTGKISAVTLYDVPGADPYSLGKEGKNPGL
jgi:prepilin-type N-terminal cleavage/methylation domain-containing protein